MKNKLGKAFLAMTIGLAMVGCTKAPTNVSPDKPAVVTPGGVDKSCGDGTVAPTPCPPPVVAPVVPLCNFIAFTSFIGGHFKLFLYDDILKDNYALPGAGEDINNPQYFDGNRIIFDRDGCILVYNLNTECVEYLNDINSAGCFGCLGERPYLARPAASWDGKFVVFIDDECTGLRRDWLRGHGFGDRECDIFNGISGRAFLWTCTPCVNVCELAKINAVACVHGGVTWIDISADGRWIVFTTGDGMLYLYDVLNPMVCLIADAMDVAPMCGDRFSNFVYILQPSISATGKQIVFTAVTMDDCGYLRTNIWRYDRILGCLDPMPFANAALNIDKLCLEFCERDCDRAYGRTEDCDEDCDRMRREGKRCRHNHHDRIRGLQSLILNPRFKCFDEENIYYEALVPGLCEGTVRALEVLDYNWVTETVRTLSILNNVVATDVINLVSDLYGPYYCVDCCDENCDRDHHHRGGIYEQK